MPAAVYWRLQLEGTATYHAEVFPLRDAAGAILGGVVIAREVSAGPGGEVGRT